MKCVSKVPCCTHSKETSVSTDGGGRASGNQPLCGQRSELVSVNWQLRGQVNTTVQSSPRIGPVSHSCLVNPVTGMGCGGIGYPTLRNLLHHRKD